MRTRKIYVFVNWKTSDIVSTSSYPGNAIARENKFYKESDVGRDAKILMENGYEYYGSYHGESVTVIHKNT